MPSYKFSDLQEGSAAYARYQADLADNRVSGNYLHEEGDNIYRYSDFSEEEEKSRLLAQQSQQLQQYSGTPLSQYNQWSNSIGAAQAGGGTLQQMYNFEQSGALPQGTTDQWLQTPEGQQWWQQAHERSTASQLAQLAVMGGGGLAMGAGLSGLLGATGGAAVGGGIDAATAAGIMGGAEVAGLSPLVYGSAAAGTGAGMAASEFGLGDAFGGMAAPEAVTAGAPIATEAGGLGRFAATPTGGLEQLAQAPTGITTDVTAGLGATPTSPMMPPAVPAADPTFGGILTQTAPGAFENLGNTAAFGGALGGGAGAGAVAAGAGAFNGMQDTIGETPGNDISQPPTPNPLGGAASTGNPLAPTGQNPMNWLGIGSDLIGMLGIRDYQQGILDVMNKAVDRSDPFYSQRPQAQAQYNNMTTNPNWLNDDPAMQAMQNTAMRNVSAQNAAKGYLNSGNILHDLTRTGVETAANYALPRMDMAARAAGAYNDPSRAGALMGQLGSTAASANLGQFQGLQSMLGRIPQQQVQGANNAIGGAIGNLFGLI